MTATQVEADHHQALIENRLEDGETRFEPVEADPFDMPAGMVPLYNPCPFPVEVQGAGEYFTLRPKSIDWVNQTAADLAVGEDFSACPGKPLYALGVRRMRMPEVRYKATAGANTFADLESWVRQENVRIRSEADNAHGGAAGLVPDISGLSAVVRAAEQQRDDGSSG